MGFTMHGDAITGAAASAEFTLYDSEKGSHTLDSTQHLEIDAISLAANGAGTIGVYITTVATGAYVFVAELTTARLSADITFPRPFICPAGVVPVLIGDDSTANFATITGFVRDA